MGVRAGRSVRRVHRGRHAHRLAVAGHRRRNDPVEHAAHQVVRGRHVHAGPALPVDVGPRGQRHEERVRGTGSRHGARRLHVHARQRCWDIGTTR